VSTSRSNSTRKARLFIVDDHPIVRQGLALVINQEPDLLVCGEAVARQEALTSIAQLHPDLAVVDLSLQNSNGMDLIKDLKEHCPTVPVLALSMHDEMVVAERALRAGARGYIMKQEAPNKLLDAIRCVLGGGIYASDAVHSQLLRAVSEARPRNGASRMSRLSDRELQVFQLVGEGRSTREIAEHLDLSIKTVETHYKRIKRKLGLNNATELLQHAALWVAGSSSRP
jgi:DNA-binding NarL/FixJ family response regulator